MRVVAPTAAVAAFSTLTLVGVAALGFASGDLSRSPSSNDAKNDWVVSAPDTVQAVSTLGDQAVAAPGAGQGVGHGAGQGVGQGVGRGAGAGGGQGGSSPVVPPADGGSGTGAAGSAGSAGSLPLVAGGRPGAGDPSVTGSTGASAGTSLPAVNPQQQAGAPAPTATGELSIHLSLDLLATTRESVAENLRAGLRGTLGTANANDLQQELNSSAGLDDAVTEATSTAAESSLRAAQEASGPRVAPLAVTQAAAIEFMRVLPDELTRTVHPVVMAALAKTGNAVPSATLNLVLSGATDDAAQQLSDLAVPQVQKQVAALVETTQGDGVPAPTATVTTEPPIPATTTTTTGTDNKSPEPSATDTTPPGRSTEPQSPDPGRPTTTAPEPTHGGSTTGGDQRGTGASPQSVPTSSATSPTSIDPTGGDGNRVVVVPSSTPPSPSTSTEASTEPSSEPSSQTSSEPSTNRSEPSTSTSSEPSTSTSSEPSSSTSSEPVPAPSATAVQADPGNPGTE